MKHLFRSVLFALLVASPAALAQQAPDDIQQAATTAAAAAATAVVRQQQRQPDFLEHLVDKILELFDIPQSGNTITHYAVSALFLVGALFLRRIVTNIIFAGLRRLASRTKTTLDDKLLPALETPVATMIMVAGIVAALRVLKLDETQDRAIDTAWTVASSVIIFWALLRAFDALLDHAHEMANERRLGIAAFMPWIKKTLIAVFVVFGVLMVVQSLGYDVRALLTTLGIGGLAFALAAQDTIANVFGSIVVAIDQPFKIGESVKIGAQTGTVEDIGLRSTRIRLADKSLAILPNKMVAAEPIVNLSRFTQRRVEHVIGLTYATTPAQMEEAVDEIRKTIRAEPEVDPSSVMVYFRDYSASSLDIWVVYVTRNPDMTIHLESRQRINLALMRLIERKGLEFAYPTQTVHLGKSEALPRQNA